MKKIKKITVVAEHFNCNESDLKHEHGRGWLYRHNGKYHFIGRNFGELQSSPNWALKQLPGRDIKC